MIPRDNAGDRVREERIMAKKFSSQAAGDSSAGTSSRALLEDGHQVRSVDVKPLDEWYQAFDDVDNARCSTCRRRRLRRGRRRA